jgi:FAD/FMN-containing dehydrogenase
MASAAATRTDLADLRQQVAGPVHGPGDAGGLRELIGHNVVVEHDPLVVVGVRDTRDVAATVRWANEVGLGVTAHATGHSSRSYRDAVVLSTRRLRGCVIDPERRVARVGAGVRWGTVVAAAAHHGLAALNASSPRVGVVGYTLAGGVGPLGRQYGFAADLVRSFELVTPEGRVVRVTPTTHPDLYWAVLGAPGSFGVVTRLEFDLVPVRQLYGGALWFDAEDAPAVFGTYQEWTTDLPDAMTSSIALMRGSDASQADPLLRGMSHVHLRVTHLGDSETGADVLAPMRRAARVLVDTARNMPYSAVTDIGGHPSQPAPSRSTGAFLESLDRRAVDALLSTAAPRHDVPLTVVELRHLGGALGRLPVRPNCVGGRDAAFLLGLVAPPDRGTKVAARRCHDVVAALAPWTSDVAPINYLNHDPEPSAGEPCPWSHSDRDRLRRLKRELDPVNTFRVGRTVQP